jgi:phosphoribosylglycinamide formyltransferase-1
VPVLARDTEESLAARVLAQEHLLYPIALRGFLAGGGHEAEASGVLRNPVG